MKPAVAATSFASNSTVETPTRTVSPQTHNEATLLGLGIRTSGQGGAEITKIDPDSPADRAGLHVGDVIQSIDGKRIGNVTDCMAAVANRPSGSKIKVMYVFKSNLGWMPGTEKVMTVQ